MRHLKQYVIICIFLILIPQPIQAQDFLLLKGGVVEQESGNAIPYVTVRVKGFAVGTITNLQGNFTFWFSDKYAKETLVFSSVGYHPVEMKVSALKPKMINKITMQIDAKDLGLVTVVDEKRMSALDILKRAIAFIPKNYPQETFLFDAYYREQITENGAVIKYADAAVTFEESKYEGKRFDVGPMGYFGTWKSAKRGGPWVGGYVGIGSVAERLHDHFRHKTSEEDKVKIHEYRASLNQTKENFFANIEAGPLGTLSKDLVKYVSHFMDKRNFSKYIYELAEIPDGTGRWDYVVKFKPKKAPKDPGQDYKIGGLGNRMEILTGEVYIDQETYVIKRMNYHVDQKYRGHICSLKLGQIVHYGYTVEVDYEQQNDAWQLNSISRTDEFLFSKSVKQNDTTIIKTIPYSAVSEIFVTKPHSEVESITTDENFANKDYNMFFDYHTSYHHDFWEKYAQQVPMAKLSETVLNDLEGSVPIAGQFEQRKLRDELLLPPKAKVNANRISVAGIEMTDEYAWLEDSKNEATKTYLREGKAYMANYFNPLALAQRNLVREFRLAQDDYQKSDDSDSTHYKSWSRFKKSNKGQYYKTSLLKAEDRNGKTLTISLLFMGKDKDRFLDDRPLVIGIRGPEDKGGRLEFDPLLVPLLKRGIVFAYVHLDVPDAAGMKVYLDMKDEEHEGLINQFVDAVEFIKENELGHSGKTFVVGEGLASSIIIGALNQEVELVKGALLSSAHADILHGVLNSTEPYISTRLGRWGNKRSQALIKRLQRTSPYENVKIHAYPNMVFFTTAADENYSQSAKMVAKLREHKTDNNKLLLKVWPTKDQVTSAERKSLELLSYQYVLMFQWMDELKQSSADASAEFGN